MTETVRSIRLYFALVATLALVAGAASLARHVAPLGFGVVVLTLGAYFAFLSARLPALLASSPAPAYVGIALLAVSSILHTIGRLQIGVIGAAIGQIVALLLCAHLFTNVRRLAEEAHARG